MASQWGAFSGPTGRPLATDTRKNGMHVSAHDEDGGQDVDFSFEFQNSLTFMFVVFF